MRIHRMSGAWVAGSLVITLFACGGVTEEMEPADGPDDSFLAAGKADTAGIQESSPDAVAVLKLASTASLSELTDPKEVGLFATTAENIVAYRQQKGSGFDTLAELDEVKYVGPVALWKMLGYVNARGLVVDGDFTIYREGEPAPLGSYTYVLHDHLLLKEYEQPTPDGSNTFTLWQLHVQAEYLAIDAQNERVIAFGAKNLYLINPAGYIEKVFDQGYDDIPNLQTHLLAGASICAVYKNLREYYAGKALGAYMVGNYWLGNWYTWWRYYFGGAYSLSGC